MGLVVMVTPSREHRKATAVIEAARAVFGIGKERRVLDLRAAHTRADKRPSTDTGD